jgi:hypothetical protein
MTLLHSPTQLITVTAVAGALAAGGVASAADAPVVSKQTWTAGYALADFPGTGFEQGEWLGSKAKMVSREVTLEPGQKVRLTLRALNGQRIRGLGATKDQKLNIVAVNRDYAGKRSVTVRATVNRRVADGEVTERVYALSR